MIQPTPAIVAQGAVNRLPRGVLLLFCLAYVLPGFVGREPWKNADVTAFGYMAELARLSPWQWSEWLAPRLMGLPPEVDALLPYWLGAWALQLAPAGLAPDFAVRLPFIALLVLAFAAVWYGIYHLARSPGAQPVAFAFGGEALPTDYARALADGGLLALLACLGLAQLSHETTPAVAQLCGTALLFHAFAAQGERGAVPLAGGVAGLVLLVLSGAPTVGAALGFGGVMLGLLDRDGDRNRLPTLLALALATGALAVLALTWNLWRWRLSLPTTVADWRSLGRLFLWFTWPAWPLVLWTFWRWRHQLARLRHHRHLALPLLFAAVPVVATLTTPGGDRSLLLALPACAALAAFALPTLRRSVSALIDWFTLLFFSGCAFVIWVIWIAMQTGFPRQPALNVARLVPGFTPVFQGLALVAALVATFAWFGLVRWRAGRHRAALWKSMVLPAGGAALCWLLLMTLWLPLLDYARSYGPLVRTVTAMTGQATCAQAHGLERAQIAAFQFHGNLRMLPADGAVRCDWLLVDAGAAGSLARVIRPADWSLQATLRRPGDKDEDIQLYRRAAPPAPGR